MSQINELRFFNECKHQVEAKLKWADSANWKQRDFEYLIELIFDKSKIRLSLSTLKRIWDKDFEGSPQLNTLNALSVFLCYKDWNDFKLSNDSNLVDNSTEIEPQLKNESLDENTRLKSTKINYIIASISILILIALLFFNRNNLFSTFIKNQVFDTTLVKFSSKTTVITGVPNSVIFNYDISQIDCDSAFIQQSWDKRRRVKIKKEDNFYSSIYYFPGNHRAKLIVNNQIVKEHNIQITTDGWMCLVQKDFKNPVPIYISSEYLTMQNQLSVEPEAFENNNIDTKNEDFYVSFYNVKQFGNLDMDNCIFETEIKNNVDDGALICQECDIILICEFGMINVPITTPGCVSNIRLIANDFRISSDTDDMSAFGCDLNNWQKIKFKNADRNLSISIEDKEIYSLDYNTSLGNLKGLLYMFHGNGSIKYININDSENINVYSEKFMTE